MILRQRGKPSKKSKRKANERLSDIEKHVAEYVGSCLFVIGDDGELCNNPVRNNCHIVSKTAVLDGLKDDKHKKVLELQTGVSNWRKLIFSVNVEERLQEPSLFDLSKRTSGTACIGRFACKQSSHDDEFQPIDVTAPDFDNPVVRFLSGYRLVLFLVDQCLMAMYLRQPWNQDVLRNARPNHRTRWQREKEKIKKTLRRAGGDVLSLGKNWHARNNGGAFDPGVVSAKVLSFRSKLWFAGGVSYGKATGVTVFPVKGDLHKMAVLHLTSKLSPAAQDLESLTAVSRASEECDNYGVSVANELLTKGWGSLAASPGSYDALNEEDRLAINRLVAEHS